ncbi:MAG: NAD(P)-dependent alcohol dehydrogenase [Gammaproteobacteria bacterium]|nr:NAD(P)-dependent alcohol dehydrogenase [Gammaproteobacteria bacterium]
MKRIFSRNYWCAALTGIAVCLLCNSSVFAAEPARQYQFVAQGNGFRIEAKSVPVPTPAANEVLVRVRATSLNRRDLLVLSGQYPAGNANGAVPLSDGAGEVVAVGSAVKEFKVGDRVAGTFFPTWLSGKRKPEHLADARGAERNGMLSEYVVSQPEGLVQIPAHLSFEEAAALPCAGLTAFNALFRKASLQPGDYVLLEGTGGVSVLALQFASAAGANVIITSSSDDKLARARELGAQTTINYRTYPDWEREVMAATNGVGVDHVLEVGGRDTLSKALSSLALGGHIAMIGGLSGFGSDIPAGIVLGKSAEISGLYVGSREDFEAMNRFITEHRITPVIDKVFEFDEALQAYEYMDSNAHFGKVVIRL